LLRRLVSYTVALVAGIAVLVFIGVGTAWGGVLAGFLAGLVLPIADEVTATAAQFRFSIISARIGAERVRISASYLYRIKVDAEYLLVRGSRYPNQFQPVGGVFKALPDGRAYLQAIGALDDDLIPIDASSRDDLRIRLPGRHLPEFVRWFDSRRGRESDAWREFHEELIAPGILDANAFPYAYSRYVRRVQHPIRYSAHAQSKELLIADVYELLPTDEQRRELERLKSEGHPSIIWASEEQIRRRGAVPGAASNLSIPSTAEWTL
jgi:SMODS-associated NUDIX domain